MLVETPPIRRLFIPRDGYVLFECDLKRADPQVCARESGEEKLLQVFRDNMDVYTSMGKWLYELPKLTNEQRQWNKNAINGCNYGCQDNTLAKTLHTTLDKAKQYRERWLGRNGLYPGIGTWHRRINEQLLRTGIVRNAYGFRRFYTARRNELLPQALAWICSSCVSVTINRGLKHVFGPNPFGLGEIMEEDRFDPWSGVEYIGIPQIELLVQIHDSFIGQFPEEMADELMPTIQRMVEVEIPYETPLIIPATMKLGRRGQAWGDLISWEPKMEKAA